MSGAYLSIEGIAKSYRQTSYRQTLALDRISIEVARGEFLALLGPSGCGKSTLLRIVAGLLEADGGRIVLDGEDIGGRPPWQRDIGLVFQNYALFPHMSVRQNVGFGLEMRKLPRAEIDRQVGEALELVRLGEFGDRRPAELSGGQQQRVAVARAIAIKPRLLLLDEPLSNLDAVLRNSVRVELRVLHERTGLTTIMVTHDQAEALTLADRIAVMSAGRVLQYDRAEAIYEQPATAFVASFVGSPPANLLRIAVGRSGALSVGGIAWAAPEPIASAVAAASRLEVLLMLRPEALRIELPQAAGALPGIVRAVEYLGGDRLTHVAVGNQVVQVRGTGASPAAGATVGLVAPLAPPILFDAETGERLSAIILPEEIPS